MNRRTVLKACGLTAAGVSIPLAGCTSDVGDVRAPSIPVSQLEDWRQLDDRQATLFEETVAGSPVEAKAHARAYEDAALRTTLADGIGPLDGPVSVVAASRIAFSFDLDRLLDQDASMAGRVERLARERFERRLERARITNLQRTSAGTLAVETGETANAFRYVADLSLGTKSVPTGDGGSTTVDLGTVPIAGDLLIWRHDGDFLVAGAAYPAADVTETLQDRRPGDSAFETAFDPATYRSTVRGYLTGVE